MKTFHKIFIGLLAGLQLSCGNTTTSSNTLSFSTDTTKKTTVLENIKVENKGVVIKYDDSKKGDTTLVFVHGWGINRTYWEKQTPFFAKKYRVVALDLPGFGESGKNRTSWTVEDYAKDVSAVLNTLDLKRVVLIGHSMSGAIVLETALNNPARVIGIVGIDNFNNFGAEETPESKKETEAFFQAAHAHYKKMVTSFANQALFVASTPKEIRKKVLDDIAGADSTISLTCLEQNGNYPINTKLRRLDIPLYLINSSANKTDTMAFKNNGIRCYLMDVGKTGHYPMLEKPDKFNSLLAQVIKNINKPK
ncbi:alpha/beta fold hydrolase [Emticicia sp. 17c]|uniref:alpha/beta fold hydrolase n=1 Tax=Emticicia sp. 17c TaxID=3127704 RepID=UPI00301BC9B4